MVSSSQQGGGDSYMEEVDIDNEDNVIVQSQVASRVEVVSYQEGCDDDKDSDRGDKHTPRFSGNRTANPTAHTSSTGTAPRGHAGGRGKALADTTGTGAFSTQQQQHRRQGGLSETESHSSLVEFGSIRGNNATYQDGMDFTLDTTLHGTTLPTHRTTTSTSERKYHRGIDDDNTSSSSREYGRHTTRSHDSGDNHSGSVREVIPLSEYADNDLRGSWESTGSSSSRKHETYDPSRYNRRQRGFHYGPSEKEERGQETTRVNRGGSSTVRSSSNTGDKVTRGNLEETLNTELSATIDTVSSRRHSGEHLHSAQTSRSPARMSSSASRETTAVGGRAAEGSGDTVRKSRDRIVKIAPDGSKVTTYGNGTIKTTSPNGTVEVRFVNGDTKTQIPSDGSVVYYYAHAQTTHTTFADETELYEFPNGQVLL